MLLDNIRLIDLEYLPFESGKYQGSIQKVVLVKLETKIKDLSLIHI